MYTKYFRKADSSFLFRNRGLCFGTSGLDVRFDGYSNTCMSNPQGPKHPGGFIYEITVLTARSDTQNDILEILHCVQNDKSLSAPIEIFYLLGQFINE